jgi:hypothetical protein
VIFDKNLSKCAFTASLGTTGVGPPVTGDAPDYDG